MVTRSKTPNRASPGAPSTAPAPDVYIAGDAIPVPDVIEKDSDSVWAMWSEAVEGGSPPHDDETQPATLLMGLPELPKERDN